MVLHQKLTSIITLGYWLTRKNNFGQIIYSLIMDLDKIMNNKWALSQIQNKLDSLKRQNIELDTANSENEINTLQSNLNNSDDAMSGMDA